MTSERVPTIAWKGNLDGHCELLDQTRLPADIVVLRITDTTGVWQAIKRLSVRGAPAIGVATAYGVVLGVRDSNAKDEAAFRADLEATCAYLASARPTAVNLFWALDRMKGAARKLAARGVTATKEGLLAEARLIQDEDRRICDELGRVGSPLVQEGDGILTHCNTGALATAGSGTALAVLFEAHAAGKSFSVFADETRPLLQGARLTAWELKRAGIDVTLICDGAAARVMSEGRVQRVFVGADRIARNGDTANKIGTYGVAVLARAHDIPFYVVAPTTTIDLKTPSGQAIPIETRDPNEVTEGFGPRTAPDGVDVYNPGFDVTPAEYLTGIVTEKGLIAPVDETHILRVMTETSTTTPKISTSSHDK